MRARLNNKSVPLTGEVVPFTKKIIDKHTAPENTPTGRLIEDYIKIFALVMDRDFCKQQLALLNQEILSAAGGRLRLKDSLEDERFSNARRQVDQNYVRVSRVLEYYEGLCWFPTTHRLYTGSLSSINYQMSIALGYMPKDAGAGAEHGEHSHRLQWQIIMRVVTQGFTVPYHKAAWHHSPLKLFCYLGTEDAMKLNYWGFMLDTAAGVRYDNPAVLNKDVSGAFETSVETDEWRRANQLLAHNVQRRTDKRRRIVQRAKQIYDALPPRSKSDKFPTTTLDFESNVIGLLEKWKKLGKPFLEKSRQWYDRGTFNETNNEILHMIVGLLWEEIRLKTASKQSRHYEQDPTEPHAALLKGDPPMTQEQLAARVERSMEELNNAAFGYVAEGGAYRKMDAWDDLSQPNDPLEFL